MSPYRESLHEMREEASKEAAKEAEKRNREEKRSKLKGLIFKEKKPITTMDILHEQAFREDDERYREFRLSLQREDRRLLGEFFGKPIDVPPPPRSITPKREQEWKNMGFELHYLPAEDMNKNREAPGWIEKPTNVSDTLPDSKFSGKMADLGLDLYYHSTKPSHSELPGKWVLMEKIKKPNAGEQYPADHLAETLGKMREAKVISSKESPDPSSRFFVSWEDLHSKRMRRGLAEALKVNSSWVRLPYFIEYNVWFQLYGSRETVDSNTFEWFEDKAEVPRTDFEIAFIGGKTDKGINGLVNVNRNPFPETKQEDIGFRLLVELPEEK